MKTPRLPVLVGLFCVLHFGRVLAAPTITATQDDGTPAATRKLVGDTVTYTTTISNTAAVIVGSTANDASNVQLTNPTPLNTTEVVGVTISPIAFDDAYPQIIFPNIGINSGNIPYSVFTNDFAGTPAVTTIASFTQPAHGTVTVVTAAGPNLGQFTYEPAAGYSGADSFTYTLTNSVGSSVGTVTLTVQASPTIWFVNPAVGLTGTGTLSSPFKTVAEAVTAIGANTSHRIFLYSGAQTTGITLKNNGWLVGQAATGTSFDSVMGIIPPSGFIARPTLNSTKPALSNASGSVVTLADNNLVVGVAITGGATGAAVASSGTVNTGLIGNATASDVTISGAAGGAFSLGAGNGNFDVNAPITSATGRSVAVTGRTGGTVAFPLAISDTGTGISLTTNTGAAINFAGGLNLSTGANAAFTATGGGTVNATQNNTTIVNTLTTTTGTALNVTGTTIGASGLTFRSISANGAATGLILNNTGTGAFTVTGTGTTAGSGGTVQNCSAKGADFRSASNISLNYMNFTNNATANLGLNTTCGDALNGTNGPTNCNSNVSLLSVTTATLNNVTATGSKQIGIDGNTVADLTLTNVTVTGNGDEVGEDGVQLVNASGTLTISGGTYKNNAANQFEVQNGVGTLTVNASNSATFSNTSYPTSITNPSNSTANGGLFLATHGSSGAAINPTVTNCIFDRIYTQAFRADMAGNTSMNINFGPSSGAGNGNTLSNSGGGAIITGTNTGPVTYSIRNNTYTNDPAVQPDQNSGGVLSARKASPANGTWTGTIQGNMIGTNGVAKSGCVIAGCQGINADTSNSSGAYNTTITGNSVYRTSGSGINVSGGGGTDSSVIRTTIQNNTMGDPEPNGFGASGQTQGNAIFVQAGSVTGDTTTVKAQIDNNTASGPWSQGFNLSAIRVRERFATTIFCLTNYNPATSYGGQPAGSNTSVSAFLTSANPASTAPAGNTVATATQTGGTITGPSCPLLLGVGGVASSAAGAKGIALTQPMLDTMVIVAISQWDVAGLTEEQRTILRNLQFEIADLSGSHLGEAEGNRIRLSRNAGGNGWYIGSDDAQFTTNISGNRRYTDSLGTPAGRIDLLTAIMHEMGHALGLDDTYAEQDRDSLMYGFLTKGERRLPAKNQAAGVVPNEKSATHFLTGSVNIGTLPPNKSVKIVYSVTVGPISGNPQSISSQATVSGSNFSSVLATDAVAGSGPTITLLGIPPSFTSATSTTFTAGTFGNFNVTANGAPTPTITFTGTLPSGVMFGMGSLAGTATAFGTFPLVFTAANGVGSNAMQNFSLVVNPSAQEVKSKPSITENGVGVFHVAFIGNPGTQYTIQFAPTLPLLPAVPNWQTLSVQTANGAGIFSFDDTPPAGTTTRFYRAVIP